MSSIINMRILWPDHFEAGKTEDWLQYGGAANKSCWYSNFSRNISLFGWFISRRLQRSMLILDQDPFLDTINDKSHVLAMHVQYSASARPRSLPLWGMTIHLVSVAY